MEEIHKDGKYDTINYKTRKEGGKIHNKKALLGMVLLILEENQRLQNHRTQKFQLHFFLTM